MTVTAIQELSQGLGEKSESVTCLISDLTEGKVVDASS